jgi:BirA family biotin operon repressor/biotin-[acetyl-CoA-carboxylase] ligase
VNLPGVVRLVRLKSTVSTQNKARKLAEAGAPSGTLVWADRQTRGRGRLARRWTSGPGGLYVTLLIRPKIGPQKLAALSLKIGRIAAKSVRLQTGLAVKIKLPNDVLARGKGTGKNAPYKKVCGILMEASGCAHEIDWVIIGIGVNVSNKIPASLAQAASLSELAGKKFTRAEILTRLLSDLKSGLKTG